MQVPLFSSCDTMGVKEWFDMLNNQTQPEQENDEQQAATYVYSVRSTDYFDLNNAIQEPGIYFMRISPAIAEELSQNDSLKLHKLSFSELVLITDVFSVIVKESIPNDEEIQEIVERGDATDYFNEFPSTEGLVEMRKKVWTKYFNSGLRAIVCRFFSALSNFFIQYNKSIDTGIYWPGNSCTYADQVVDQLNRIKRIFIHRVYEANKEILSDHLGKTVEELQGVGFGVIKKLYMQKALQFHPDKNSDDAAAAAQFTNINRIWTEFVKLHQLKEDFKADQLEDEIEEESHLLSKKEPVSNKNLAKHTFKTILALPVPIPPLSRLEAF